MDLGDIIYGLGTSHHNYVVDNMFFKYLLGKNTSKIKRLGKLLVK